MKIEKVNSKIILILSLFVLIYWFIGHNSNIYKYTIVGVIYELLWLPMLFLLFTLPILSIFMMVNNRFKQSSLWFLCIGIQIFTIFFTIFFKA